MIADHIGGFQSRGHIWFSHFVAVAPPAACPRRKDRQVLMRTTMHDGKHRNALVAFLDLKDGQEPPAEVEDEAAWLDACETTLSDGCRDHASCGEAHEYDAAHVHTRDTRLDVDTPSMDSQIYLARQYAQDASYPVAIVPTSVQGPALNAAPKHKVSTILGTRASSQE